MTESRLIYHIFLDRFIIKPSTENIQNESKDVFIGGSIAEIIESIPILASLGFTALLVTPWYEGKSYHGYHVTDFKKVDPRWNCLSNL
jgi:cyclomaltodextrinase